MTKLQRSEEFHRKMSFLRNKVVPTQTELKLRVGTDLAKIMFDSTDPQIQHLLGSKPPMEGPGDELWVSPSDCLIGHVRLKPPLTTKYIKALTHQGILEIGAKVERRFIEELEGRLVLALKGNTERLKYIAERDRNRAIEATIKSMQEKFEQELLLIYREFEIKLKEALQRQKEALEIEKQFAVREGKIEMKNIMQKKVEEVIKITVSKLIEEYAKVLEQQSQKWHEHFKYHLRLCQEHLERTIAKEKQKCDEKIHEMYTDLECDFIANMMYVVCSERRRCQCEKKDIEIKHAGIVKGLQDALEETTRKLEEAKKETQEEKKQVQSREEALFSIIQEFQKFIYFVLRAQPKQAEYLLDIKRLMVFELTKTVMEINPAMFQGSSLIDLTRRSSESSDESKPKTAFYEESEGSESMETQDLLTAKDYHACDNKQRVDESAHTLNSSEDLPAFKFGENIFIREDFRNMISQGLRIHRSNHYWNYEIDDLTKLLTTEHGICLKKESVAQFPCMTRSETSDDVCTKVFSRPPPQLFSEKHRKRLFYETCMEPCDMDEVKVPPDDAVICTGKCIQEPKEEVCDYTCKQEIKSEPEFKVIKLSGTDLRKPIPVILKLSSCKDCALFRKTSEPPKKRVTVECDCFPSISTPNIETMKGYSRKAAEVLTGHHIIDVSDSILDEIPQVDNYPIHFAKNSQELIRHKSILKSISQQEKVLRVHDLEANVTECRVRPVKFTGPTPKFVDQKGSKFALAADSKELLVKKQSKGSFYPNKLYSREFSGDLRSISTTSSKDGPQVTFSRFTDYLDKSERRKSVRYSLPALERHVDKVIFESPPTRNIEPKRWSIVGKNTPSIHSSDSTASSVTLRSLSIRDARVDNFVKNIAGDDDLRRMFLY